MTVVVCGLGISLAGCQSVQASPHTARVTAAARHHPAASPTAASATTPLTALVLGQCVVEAEDSLQPKVGSTTVIPCSQAHAGEVYALPSLPGATYPGVESVSSTASDACSTAFAGYTGDGVQTSHLDFAVDIPTSDQWASGDHSALCILFSPQGNMIGSAKGIGSSQPQFAP